MGAQVAVGLHAHPMAAGAATGDGDVGPRPVGDEGRSTRTGALLARVLRGGERRGASKETDVGYRSVVLVDITSADNPRAGHAPPDVRSKRFKLFPAANLEGLLPANNFYRLLKGKLDLSFVRDLCGTATRNARVLPGSSQRTSNEATIRPPARINKRSDGSLDGLPRRDEASVVRLRHRVSNGQVDVRGHRTAGSTVFPASSTMSAEPVSRKPKPADTGLSPGSVRVGFVAGKFCHW